MNNEAKRLAPTGVTLREVFLKSGNLCAFPSCPRLMMNAEGAFVGQVCHIEAAELGGERFNPAMSNEERRAASNLLLMCYEHHVITNDVEKYPVAEMRKIKADHEARFSSPQRSILATLRDWTTAETIRLPATLSAMGAALKWTGLSAGHRAESAKRLADYLERLALVPIEVRSFLGKLASRAHRTRALSTVEVTDTAVRVACFDIERAFRLDSREVQRLAQELDSYGLGYLDELYQGERSIPAIVIRGLDGWNFWLDLARFCESSGLPMETFSEDLGFSALD